MATKRNKARQVTRLRFGQAIDALAWLALGLIIIGAACLADWLYVLAHQR